MYNWNAVRTNIGRGVEWPHVNMWSQDWQYNSGETEVTLLLVVLVRLSGSLILSRASLELLGLWLPFQELPIWPCRCHTGESIILFNINIQAHKLNRCTDLFAVTMSISGSPKGLVRWGHFHHPHHWPPSGLLRLGISPPNTFSNNWWFLYGEAMPVYGLGGCSSSSRCRWSCMNSF